MKFLCDYFPRQSDWFPLLEPVLKEEGMRSLSVHLQEKYAVGERFYPCVNHIFKAFELTALADVKVVIIGQDPYHGEGQAHGLSFSVPQEQAIPPSLRNIFKELERDYAETPRSSGNLEAWARQGVLLLNSVLTVQAGLAASHQKLGWEQFTDTVVEVVNQNCSNVVFLLWGAYAQKKGKTINADKHLVLTAPHPSPLSAHRGFFGCRHFSQANAYLKAHHGYEIDWLGE